MVDVVGAVVRVVDALPPERQLVVVALLGPLLLHPRQPRVQPVRRARVVVDEVRLALKLKEGKLKFCCASIRNFLAVSTGDTSR